MGSARANPSLPAIETTQSELTTNWYYRWGDSPRNPDDSLSWLTELSGGDSSWRPQLSFQQPFLVSDDHFVWLAITLPTVTSVSDSFYLPGIDQIIPAPLPVWLQVHHAVADGYRSAIYEQSATASFNAGEMAEINE